MGKDKDKARAYSRAWKAKNQDRVKAYRKAYGPMYRATHRESLREHQRNWALKNPDKIKSYHKKRYDKIKGRKLSKWLVVKLLIEQKYRCPYCQIKLKKKDFEKDHIYPLATNGTHADDNIQILCWDCNRKKGKKSPTEYMQMIGMLPWPAKSA